MSFKIFTKKSFKFEAEGKVVQTRPFSFHYVDDWVKNTELYQLAKGEGSIEEIANSKDAKVLENNPNASLKGKKTGKRKPSGEENPNSEDDKDNEDLEGENPNPDGEDKTPE